MNDGSTDNSAEILAEYAFKDSRIKVFTQDNAGLSAARNTGLENATGEWIAGVDSDDWLELTCIEQAVSRIQADVDLVYFGAQLVDEKGCTQVDEKGCIYTLAGYSYFSDKVIDDITPITIWGLNACFWSKLWRRRIIEQHHLRFPDGLINEDQAFFYLFLPYAKKMSLTHSIGYNYVQRKGSIMSELNDGGVVKIIESYLAVAAYVYQQYNERNLWRAPYRAYAQHMFASFCEVGFEERELFIPCAHLFCFDKRDYRFVRLKRVTGWGTLFLSRYQQAEIYRFFKIPVICVNYSMDGTVGKKRIILFSSIKHQLLTWQKKIGRSVITFAKRWIKSLPSSLVRKGEGEGRQ